MKYRALWKSTWYTSKDYGALCRCLAQLGAQSFFSAERTVTPYSQFHLLCPDSVLIVKYDDDEED